MLTSLLILYCLDRIFCVLVSGTDSGKHSLIRSAILSSKLFTAVENLTSLQTDTHVLLTVPYLYIKNQVMGLVSFFWVENRNI